MPKKENHLSKAINAMAEEFQACRDTGHNWRVTLHFHSKSFGDTIGRRLVCMQCGTQKTVYVNRMTGETLATNYSYVPGYQLKGFGKEYRPHQVTRQVRISILARVKIEEVEEE